MSKSPKKPSIDQLINRLVSDPTRKGGDAEIWPQAKRGRPSKKASSGGPGNPAPQTEGQAQPVEGLQTSAEAGPVQDPGAPPALSAPTDPSDPSDPSAPHQETHEEQSRPSEGSVPLAPAPSAGDLRPDKGEVRNGDGKNAETGAESAKLEAEALDEVREAPPHAEDRRAEDQVREAPRTAGSQEAGDDPWVVPDIETLNALLRRAPRHPGDAPPGVNVFDPKLKQEADAAYAEYLALRDRAFGAVDPGVAERIYKEHIPPSHQIDLSAMGLVMPHPDLKPQSRSNLCDDDIDAARRRNPAFELWSSGYVYDPDLESYRGFEPIFERIRQFDTAVQMGRYLIHHDEAMAALFGDHVWLDYLNWAGRGVAIANTTNPRPSLIPDDLPALTPIGFDTSFFRYGMPSGRPEHIHVLFPSLAKAIDASLQFGADGNFLSDRPWDWRFEAGRLVVDGRPIMEATLTQGVFTEATAQDTPPPSAIPTPLELIGDLILRPVVRLPSMARLTTDEMRREMLERVVDDLTYSRECAINFDSAIPQCLPGYHDLSHPTIATLKAHAAYALLRAAILMYRRFPPANAKVVDKTAGVAERRAGEFGFRPHFDAHGSPFTPAFFREAFDRLKGLAPNVFDDPRHAYAPVDLARALERDRYNAFAVVAFYARQFGFASLDLNPVAARESDFWWRGVGRSAVDGPQDGPATPSYVQVHGLCLGTYGQISPEFFKPEPVTLLADLRAAYQRFGLTLPLLDVIATLEAEAVPAPLIRDVYTLRWDKARFVENKKRADAEWARRKVETDWEIETGRRIPQKDWKRLPVRPDSPKRQLPLLGDEDAAYVAKYGPEAPLLTAPYRTEKVRVMEPKPRKASPQAGFERRIPEGAHRALRRDAKIAELQAARDAKAASDPGLAAKAKEKDAEGRPMEILDEAEIAAILGEDFTYAEVRAFESYVDDDLGERWPLSRDGDPYALDREYESHLPYILHTACYALRLKQAREAGWDAAKIDAYFAEVRAFLKIVEEAPERIRSGEVKVPFEGLVSFEGTDSFEAWVSLMRDAIARKVTKAYPDGGDPDALWSLEDLDAWLKEVDEIEREIAEAEAAEEEARAAGIIERPPLDL